MFWIAFISLIVAILFLVYVIQRTNSLERQMTLVPLSSCFQISRNCFIE